MGFIDAAMVEEGVKLIAARGKAPWFWCGRDCASSCGPGYRPCCLPGWRSGEATGRLLDPWSYLIYMVVAGAGFSTCENMEYLFTTADVNKHLSRPDCYDAPSATAIIENVVGRVLLAYPLHLACGALTGLQLIRHHLSVEKLPLVPWVLIPVSAKPFLSRPFLPAPPRCWSSTRSCSALDMAPFRSLSLKGPH